RVVLEDGQDGELLRMYPAGHYPLLVELRQRAARVTGREGVARNIGLFHKTSSGCRSWVLWGICVYMHILSMGNHGMFPFEIGSGHAVNPSLGAQSRHPCRSWS